jgi:hypothetical protein
MPHWNVWVEGDLVILLMVACLLTGVLLGFAWGWISGNGPVPVKQHGPIPRVQHRTQYGESFEYTPQYPQDAATNIFPILPAVSETQDIPVFNWEFESIVNNNYPKG